MLINENKGGGFGYTHYNLEFSCSRNLVINTQLSAAYRFFYSTPLFRDGENLYTSFHRNYGG